MHYTLATTILALLFLSGATGAQSADDDLFFRQRRGQLLSEYYRCTGDSAEVAIGNILSWKEGINAWSQTIQFDSLYRAFIEQTDSYGKDILPCDVYAWAMGKRKLNRIDSINTAQALAIRRRAVQDSITIFTESTTLPRSPFDFDSIQFGVSKLTFQALYSMRHNHPLIVEGERILVRSLPIDGREYLGSFEFGAINKLMRYELQSVSLSGDSLDSVIRGCAETLSARLERKLGKPTHWYRVGYFEIVQGRLHPYKVWRNKDFEAIAGFGTFKHKYYAKLTVTSNRDMRNHLDYKPIRAPRTPMRTKPLPAAPEE